MSNSSTFSLVYNGQVWNLSNEVSEFVLRRLNQHGDLKDAPFLDNLANDVSSRIRLLAAELPEISLESVRKLSQDPSYKVRTELLSTSENLERLTAEEVIASVAEQPHMIEDLITDFDNHPDAREIIAHYRKHPDPYVTDLIEEHYDEDNDLRYFDDDTDDDDTDVFVDEDED